MNDSTIAVSQHENASEVLEAASALTTATRHVARVNESVNTPKPRPVVRLQ